MNFLVPWFLLGAAAIAGPVLFHLIRRAARERIPFSSIMFLRPTPPKMTRRRKLEHFWLLLLRCLCLLLLAFAFARPFFASKTPPPVATTSDHQTILLVDTSASMKRAGVWENAVSLAENYFANAAPGDQIALMTFDRQPRAVVNFSEWSSWPVNERAALARERLAAISPGWMGTRLGLALTSAAEQLLAESDNGKTPGRREIVFISDMQEGAKLDGLQGYEWPRGVRVKLEPVKSKRATNAGLEIPNAAAISDGAPRIRVASARDSQTEKFRVNWISENRNVGDSMEIYVPPGQVRTFTAPKIPASLTQAQLQLSGDSETFDNIAWFARPEASRVTIAYLGSEPADDPSGLRFYLQRVFPDTPGRQVRLVSPTNTSDFSGLLKKSAFAVIPKNLSAEEIAAVRDWLAQGKSALIVLTSAAMSQTLGRLAGLPDIQLTEADGNYALLGNIDFTHPLFAPFADPRFSDFTAIHFWKHRRWEIPAAANAKVLAKFDDDSPALAELKIGKGRLLALASGWNPADSQLAVSSKFPPLMQTVLDWSGATSTARFQFSTGDSIPSPALAGNGSVEWRANGKTETLPAGAAFTKTETPGIYVATFGGSEQRFAVNLPLDESRVAPFSPDDLARLGVPLQSAPELSAAQIRERETRLQNADLENRQKLWRWLIAAALAITFGEILLSGRISRRAEKIEVAA
ncbi:MAG TPA: BatA domain-containing protein [Verrucomicrobiae bacterium]|nr:BatA domain-containing protein [Verrucomicrobiae bacterium]